MDPLQLVELLRGHRTYIQTHNFPDPDAIASAFGLQHFLNYHGIKADICYDGKIERLSTRCLTHFILVFCLKKIWMI